MKVFLTALTALTGLPLTFPFLVQSQAQQEQESMTLELGKFSKDYDLDTPLSESGYKIGYVNDFYDDINLIKLSAYKLAHIIVKSGLHMQLNTVVVPGDKANCIGWALVQILRHLKPSVEMAVFHSVETSAAVHTVSYRPSMDSSSKVMQIRSDQLHKIEGKKIIVLDDVISSGSTVKAAKELVEKSGGAVLGFACVATEGPEDPGQGATLEGLPLLHVKHFPVAPVGN